MKFRSVRLIVTLASILLMSVAFATQAQATNYRGQKNYRVTITNTTQGVQFTPILAATHRSSVGFFELGQAPSTQLAEIAEGGNIAPLQEVLDSLSNEVAATANTIGLLSESSELLFPGESVTIEISTSRRAHFLSLAAMLLPTNDSFVALDTVALPAWGSRTYYAKGYDAGSETNDEMCASIPGPTCGGDGAFKEVNGEGYVHISPGIHGIGDLAPSEYDWKNPVAVVTVQRIR